MTDHASKPRPDPNSLFPLADHMRPDHISEVYGQEHLTGPGKILSDMAARGQLSSTILWGPPGTGKTTLSRILAKSLNTPSMEFSATVSRIAEIRAVMQEANATRDRCHRPLVVFVDEIHHFNKHMQDAFLSFVEKGDIVLLGTTTENPAFKLNRALISRMQIFELRPLGDSHLETILDRALTGIRETGIAVADLSAEAAALLIRFAAGDARRLLNGLEMILRLGRDAGTPIQAEEVALLLQKKVKGYDRSGDDRYQLISAFHKSVRNSDVDASLYWLHRMLAGGEDPLFILRRMIRITAEDIGLADPQALRICLDAREAYDFIGSPEGEIFLTMATIYLASAPKSNSLYATEKRMQQVADRYGNEPVPLHLINPSHFLAARKGAGRDYLYAHDFATRTTPMQTMPAGVPDKGFYSSGEFGFEKTIHERIQFWREQKMAMERAADKKEQQKED
ncbi:MAG TPA: replication-associated recombination protein A [Candidatus Aminicenantes bacterium]|nr:replication-associated recombination protein A [Candidatus Aminicenantes bacterium]